MQIFGAIKKIVDRISFISGVLSTVSIVVIMFAVVLDVTLRWLKVSIYGVFELNGLLVGITVYLGLALTQAQKKHIGVSLLGPRMPSRLRSFIQIPMLTLVLVFFSWLVYLYGRKAYAAFVTGEVIPGFVKFPVFPLKAVMTFGVGLLAIQLFIDVVTEIKRLFDPETDDEESKIETEGSMI